MKLEFLKNGMYKGKKYNKGSIINFETQDTDIYLQTNLCRISFKQDKEIIITADEIKKCSKTWTGKNNQFEVNIYVLGNIENSGETVCTLPIFKTYEEALEIGLYQALLLIK